VSRTALEPICEALAAIIRERRIASGLSLNRLAEFTVVTANDQLHRNQSAHFDG
jgi:hypothetical protein